MYGTTFALLVTYVLYGTELTTGRVKRVNR